MPRLAKPHEKVIWPETRKQDYFKFCAKKTFNQMFDDWQGDDTSIMDFIRHLINMNDYRFIILMISKPDFNMSMLDDIKGSKPYVYVATIASKYYATVQNCYETEKKRQRLTANEIFETGIFEQNTYDVLMQKNEVACKETCDTGYLLRAGFFMKDLERFRKTGALYIAMKEVLNQHKVDTWSKLGMRDRCIADCDAVIEYFIWTGELPVQINALTDKAIHSNRYNTQTYKDLMMALVHGQVKQVATLIKLYYDLPISYKRQYRHKIYVMRINLFTLCSRRDHHIIKEWISGDFEKEES